MIGWSYRPCRRERLGKTLALIFPLILTASLPAAGWAANDEPPVPHKAPRAAVYKGEPGAARPHPAENAEPAADDTDTATPSEPDATGQSDAGPEASEADKAGARDAAKDKDGKEPADSNAEGYEARGMLRAKLLRQLVGGDTMQLETSPSHPPTVTEDMGLEEAVALALKNNFEVKAAAEKTDAAKWDLRATYGQFLPQVEYTYEKGKEESKPAGYHLPATVPGTQGALAPDDSHRYWGRTWGIHQPIIYMAAIADILGRHANESSAELDERSVRERVAMDTIASYFRVLRAELSIRYAADYKAALDKIGGRMANRVKGGGASGVELERVKARSVAARSAIIEARSEMEAALVEFRRLSGVMPLKFAMPERLMPSVPDNVDVVLQRAYLYNPDYLSSLKKVDVSEYDSMKAHARMLPKLTFDVTNSRVYNSGGAAYDTADGTTAYPYNNDMKVLGTLTWTLNGGVDFGEGMSAAATARQYAFTADDNRLRLEESIRTAYDALNAANGRIDATQKAVQGNKKVAAAFEEQYTAGNRPLLDLLDIEERLYQSQIELTQLILAEAQAGYILRRQMGELVPALLQTGGGTTLEDQQQIERQGGDGDARQ